MDRVIAIAYGQKSKDYHGVYFSMVATHRGAAEKETRMIFFLAHRSSDPELSIGFLSFTSFLCDGLSCVDRNTVLLIRWIRHECQ